MIVLPTIQHQQRSIDMPHGNHLPSWLEIAIENLIKGYPLADLQQAYADLSLRYRSQEGASGYHCELESLAYVAARLPATYAVVKQCLTELPKGYAPTSILDLGAGPGTASLACLETFTPSTIHLIEQDRSSIEWGRNLLAAAPDNTSQTFYKTTDLLNLSLDTSYDLVLASYVFGELTPDQQQTLFHRALALTSDYCLIILPGTPKGFSIINTLRNLALEQDISIVAPCTHSQKCPLKDKDWCHFPVRLPRSTWHKRLKGGDLGYEDEKYSYLLLSKNPVTPAFSGRIIKHPHHASGHGTLDVCTNGQLKTLAYSRKKSPGYQDLKRLQWGNGVK